jgi:hypothetical protein
MLKSEEQQRDNMGEPESCVVSPAVMEKDEDSLGYVPGYFAQLRRILSCNRDLALPSSRLEGYLYDFHRIDISSCYPNMGSCRIHDTASIRTRLIFRVFGKDLLRAGLSLSRFTTSCVSGYHSRIPPWSRTSASACERVA